jgi:phosphoesterase RecJ-like protein
MERFPNQDIIEFIEDFRKKSEKKLVIVPHVNPDGDAIGSAMAMYHFFKSTNVVQVVMPSSFPDFLAWMPDVDKAINNKDDSVMAEDEIANADFIILVDHNAPDRSGEMEVCIEKSSAKKLMIDHHPEPSYPVDFKISSTEVSSTAELIYNFISTIDDKSFTPEISASIYVGLMTDTGNFVHNVHPGTFRAVSDLIQRGIDRDDIYNRVFNNYSFDRMQLMGYALSHKTEHLPQIGFAIMSLNKQELERYNYIIGDTEGFVNLPLAIAGVNASVLIMERNGEVKLSFRSKGDRPINKIARQYFNGGGHKNAAGGTEFELGVEATVIKLKDILDKEKLSFK